MKATGPNIWHLFPECEGISFCKDEKMQKAKLFFPPWCPWCAGLHPRGAPLGASRCARLQGSSFPACTEERSDPTPPEGSSQAEKAEGGMRRGAGLSAGIGRSRYCVFFLKSQKRKDKRKPHTFIMLKSETSLFSASVSCSILCQNKTVFKEKISLWKKRNERVRKERIDL